MEIISREDARNKGLKRYFTGLDCVNGHISERNVGNKQCLQCGREYAKEKRKKAMMENPDLALKKERERYHAKKEKDPEGFKLKQSARYKKYFEENKERVREQKRKREARVKAEDPQGFAEKRREACRKYYHKNADAMRKRNKEYREENKDRLKEYRKQFNMDNQDRVRERWRRWHKDHPLQSFYRDHIRRIETAIGEDRVSRAEDALGYTQDEFLSHLESQFEDGMSWENRSEWHIDHVKPIAQFIKEGVTDVKVIHALSNLKPLWAKDNLSKGSKYDQV